MKCKHPHIGYLIRVLDSQYRKLNSQELAAYDLTPSQFEVLFFIFQQEQENKKTIQKDIEQYFHISNPSVSGLISRLEQKSFVVRLRNEKDRRTWYLQTTPKFHEIQKQLWQNKQANEQFVESSLGAARYHDLISSLVTVSTLLQQLSKEESHV